MLPLRLPPDGLLPGPPLPTGSLPAGWVVRASFSPPARQTCRAHKQRTLLASRRVRCLEKAGTPNGIRTRAAALKGRCPRPLDDGGIYYSLTVRGGPGRIRTCDNTDYESGALPLSYGPRTRIRRSQLYHVVASCGKGRAAVAVALKGPGHWPGHGSPGWIRTSNNPVNSR